MYTDWLRYDWWSLLHVVLDKKVHLWWRVGIFDRYELQIFCTNCLPRSIVFDVHLHRIQVSLMMIQTILKDTCMQTSLYTYMYTMFFGRKARFRCRVRVLHDQIQLEKVRDGIVSMPNFCSLDQS
jgi:hypothetical protein